MNRLILLILFLWPLSLSAQLTIGEVYDFDLGDEFHYKSNFKGPTWIERKIVIDKWWSEDSSIVNYKWNVVLSGIDPNNLKTFVESREEITFHTSLDSSIYSIDLNEFLYGNKSDETTFIKESRFIDSTFNTWFVIDTTISFDSSVCNFNTNALMVREGPYPHLVNKKYIGYGKGLGNIYFENEFSDRISNEYHFFEKLFYFKKSDTTCGVPDYTNIENNATVKNIAIYPNPVQETIHLSSTHSYKYLLFTNSGKLVFQGVSNGIIDVSTLPKGIYILKLQLEGQFQIKKFVKLNSQL